MTNYGLPLRFKAVDTETGDALLHNDDGESRIHAERPSDKFLLRLESDLFLSDNILNVSFYQSTGHYDANGQEVFFADVAVNSDGVMGVVVMKNQGEMAFDSMFNPGFEFYRPLLYSSEWTIIGNRHTPKSELEARAKAVAEGIRLNSEDCY